MMLDWGGCSVHKTLALQTQVPKFQSLRLTEYVKYVGTRDPTSGEVLEGQTIICCFCSYRQKENKNPKWRVPEECDMR